MQYISFDAHKHYTIACVERQNGGIMREARLQHQHSSVRADGARASASCGKSS